MRRLLGSWLILGLGLLACGEELAEPELGGSVSTLGYSLAYDSTRIRLAGGQLAIQYVDGRQIPVQVIVDVTGAELTGPATINLTEHGDVIGERENASLPDLIRGQVTFDAYGADEGASVSGQFDATVERNGREYTVYGAFSGNLEIIGP